MLTDPEPDLTLTRHVDASPEALFACWTTPQHMKQFFVPRPHQVTHAEVDLRVGGRFNTVMLVDGQEIPNFGVVLEIVAGRKLVFTDAYTEGWKPAPDPFMTAILTFEPDGDGAIFTAVARHRSAEARAQHEKMGFHEGWGVVVQQLEDYAKSL
ncbi:SRPBCC family protein [Citreicella sp. C3M06]|uniref:SRPBCC family protein n=1 Tax=Citreicella sp. C3M06 TaxID=2841564 RepID=UPI001C080465|nr:SRPBCC family protein [Citreicella sp. C3M06]MBU2959372.1 SRPBCC family protein [Citreicella sp. C3M06]